jgi:hypothetical protein
VLEEGEEVGMATHRGFWSRDGESHNTQEEETRRQWSATTVLVGEELDDERGADQ